MKGRSKFSICARDKAITSAASRPIPGASEPYLSVDAKTEARMSISTDDQGRVVLSISGKGLWGNVVMTRNEAARIGAKMVNPDGKPKTDPDVKTYYFVRKAKEGAMS